MVTQKEVYTAMQVLKEMSESDVMLECVSLDMQRATITSVLKMTERYHSQVKEEREVPHAIDSYFQYEEDPDLLKEYAIVLHIGPKYVSEVITDITEDKVMDKVQESFTVNEDYHHIFFEGTKFMHIDEHGVKHFSAYMGS